GIRDRNVTGVQTCALPISGIGALVWLGVGIGVAATAATYMQTRNGEAGWGDVAMSALGIIPVTKVSKVAGAGATGVLSKSAKAEIGRASCRERVVRRVVAG